jgi:hypothetical protein
MMKFHEIPKYDGKSQNSMVPVTTNQETSDHHNTQFRIAPPCQELSESCCSKAKAHGHCNDFLTTRPSL